jgi:hypothetical protein
VAPWTGSAGRGWMISGVSLRHPRSVPYFARLFLLARHGTTRVGRVARSRLPDVVLLVLAVAIALVFRGSFRITIMITITIMVELNGAFSNPRPQLELRRLGALHGRLVAQAAVAPRTPQPVSPGRPQVLLAVSRVLEAADRPMRACEVHRAAEQLVGEPLLWTSVKAALAAGTTGLTPCFRRVAYGVYQAAG